MKILGFLTYSQRLGDRTKIEIIINLNQHRL